MNSFLQAQIFSGFPSWKAIAYQKELTPKLLQFEVRDMEEVRPLYLASIISKDEKMAWQSFQDVLGHTMGLAQVAMRGFFGFDVLSVDLGSGMKHFDPKALSQLIINHSRGLGPDQKALIRYGQLFALLHYRAPAEWGKIEVKTHVEFSTPCLTGRQAGSASAEVTEASALAALMGSGAKNKNSSGDQSQSFFNNCSEAEIGAVPATVNEKKKKPGQLDLLLKKLLRESACPPVGQGGEPRAIYLLHDLSVHAIWDPANGAQQQRVRIWLEKEKQTHQGILPEIYLHHSSIRTRLPV